MANETLEERNKRVLGGFSIATESDVTEAEAIAPTQDTVKVGGVLSPEVQGVLGEPAPIPEAVEPPPTFTPETLTEKIAPVGFLQAAEVPPPDVTKLEVPEKVEPLVEDVALTGSQREAQSLTEELQALNVETLGESAFRAAEEEGVDVSGKIQTINDLTNRFNALKNEALAIPLQVEQESIGRRSLAEASGMIKERRRQNAIQSLGVLSLLQAAQGNLSTALDLVDRAVAAEFDPIREEIAVRRANLQLVIDSPEFTVDQQNQAKKLLEQTAEREAFLTEQAEEKKGIGETAITAIENGADALTVRSIQGAESLQEARAILAEFTSQITEPREDFTLGRGQVRFDAEGNVIARGEAFVSDAVTKRILETNEKNAQALETQTQTIGLINSILASADLEQIGGASRLGIGARLAGSAGVRSQVVQLKALTSLEGRQKLKGSGTISDFEAKMLSDSANALNFAIQDDGRIAMSDEEIEQNLLNIRGALASKSGIPVTVIVTDPATGESFLFEDLKTSELQEAALQGFIVDYQ